MARTVNNQTITMNEPVLPKQVEERFDKKFSVKGDEKYNSGTHYFFDVGSSISNEIKMFIAAELQRERLGIPEGEIKEIRDDSGEVVATIESLGTEITVEPQHTN